MPRIYVRTTLRGSWSEENLHEAMEKVKSQKMGVNQASRHYKIPSRTLRRHLQAEKCKIPYGRPTVLSEEHEKSLVAHIKKLQKVGMAPDRKDIKEIAYQFAETLNIKHPFSNTTMSAGNAWLNGFLKRNPELLPKREVEKSSAKLYDINDDFRQGCLNILLKIYQDNNPDNCSNKIPDIDHIRTQINTELNKILTLKESKEIFTQTEYGNKDIE
ncbi:uncharacterized protein [Chelonus insularis]|uniref:uncharacterized protein n=1 Tax=Chelonus insularis TaxID=460826 RepID=UPI00158EC42E|nr:uncharacterized protein LOC118065134 [Chelonus insularis]XP_034936110.1 uncharacterized protein LOC118065134 [Chelonus insularis]XP_034936111.1 uncharacterized protein LOC118065134 [Chelonus insularis]